MQIFYFFNSYSVGPLHHGFYILRRSNPGSKAVFSIHGWESVDMDSQLYALIYTILHKEL